MEWFFFTKGKTELGVNRMDRTIFHCDLNSFYASVELLSHPELRHLPVAVCGDPASRHGIILAKNEPAKSFQVKTGGDHMAGKAKVPQPGPSSRPSWNLPGFLPKNQRLVSGVHRPGGALWY